MKINVKKTKSLRLGISEDEKVTLGNEKIDQVRSFTYLGAVKMLKVEKLRLRVFFSQLEKKFGGIGG